MEGLLVSTNLSGCGFVYGSLSFLDKLACGVALYWIEGMNGKEIFSCIISQIVECLLNCKLHFYSALRYTPCKLSGVQGLGFEDHLR